MKTVESLMDILIRRLTTLKAEYYQNPNNLEVYVNVLELESQIKFLERENIVK